MRPPDNTSAMVSPPHDAVQAEPLSRRSMLRGAAGAGAAGLALTTLGAPALAATRLHPDAAGAAGRVPDDIADGEAVVVHVRNVRSGELDVYRGTSHVRLLDRALAARLARASQQRGGNA